MNVWCKTHLVNKKLIEQENVGTIKELLRKTEPCHINVAGALHDTGKRREIVFTLFAMFMEVLKTCLLVFFLKKICALFRYQWQKDNSLKGSNLRYERMKSFMLYAC